MDNWNLACRHVDQITGKSVTSTVSFQSLATGDDRITGRPLLLSRLWPGLEALCGDLAPKSVGNSRNRLREYWAYLDECQNMVATLQLGEKAILDLEWSDIEASWRQWVEWLRARKIDSWRAQTTFRFVKRVIEIAHAHEQELNGREALPLELFGYFRRETAVKIRDSLTIDDARVMFKALRQEWRDSVSRVKRFNAIADQGRLHRNDPSLMSRQKEANYWQNESNRLSYVRRHFPWGANGLNRSHVKNVLSNFRNYPPPRVRQYLPAKRKFKKVNAYLGAVFLTQADLAVAAAIVAMKTPLNPSTIGNMCASNWCVPDPQHPHNRVVIFARKARSNGDYQKAYSSIKGVADPYQVIKTIVQFTEPLRQAAREMVEILRTNNSRSSTEEQLLRHLERVSDAIWIYPSAQFGIVDLGLRLGDACQLEHQVIDRVLRDVRTTAGRRCKFRLGDGREMWAQYIYERSGHNLLLTQQTLGHKGLGALIRYLNARVLRTRNFVQLAKLQKHVFTELSHNRFNPRLLRSLVNQGAINAETASRLKSGTTNRLGLVCSDPTHPDKLADLGHREGELCKEQNCMFCWKWYATGESLPYLQRALLDLSDIERQTPVLLWQGSSYPLWRVFFQAIADRFSVTNQKAALSVAEGMPSILLPVRFTSARRRK